MPQLIVSLNGETEQELDLTERLTIGRSSSNGLVLRDTNTSRRHAEIRSHGSSTFRVIDLGSANGTWLNGRRITAPTDLCDGDNVTIGNTIMRFIASEEDESEESSTMSDKTMATSVSMRNEMLVVMVSDIRGYTRLSEELPAADLSKIVSDWFGECTRLIEAHGGTVDKFIGDAVMAYWTAKDGADPSVEIVAAITVAKKKMELSEVFNQRISAEFPGKTFRIGIGLNVGEAIFGNVGTAQNPSFTIVGDCVNVAFRLESISKEKGHGVIISQAIADHAPTHMTLHDLGEIQVKGRQEPVPALGLEV